MTSFASSICGMVPFLGTGEIMTPKSIVRFSRSNLEEVSYG
jgi:hypothetical protein